ncbi:MAG TPA: hypothetical protein VMP12_06190 [Candidatus Sulfotelmatobacter sp.]|nr:hypothetical protein [Candidatus Sulfotelmatobacter sp.]
MVSRRNLAVSVLTLFLLAAACVGGAPISARPANRRVALFPKLVAGQVLTYQIAYHASKSANTKSTVATSTPRSPSGTETNVRALLRLEVVGVEMQGQRATIRARSYFQVMNSATHLTVPRDLPTTPDQVQRQDPKGVSIEFTIHPDGRVDPIKGLDMLFPEQQQAWKEWVARFAASAALPEGGIRIGQKWKSEELEKSPAPIAKLTWLRESSYLRDEPCHISELTIEGDIAAVHPQQVAETCAVIETSATLKQRSSTKDATPEDYKLHELLTSGTASGDNKTLLFVSTQTGLLVRSSDHADQKMSVTIAKADNSNRVHYDIQAKSDTEIFRIANSPLNTSATSPTN